LKAELLETAYHIFRQPFLKHDLSDMVLAKAGVPENKVDAQIPEGRPKSGRTWKVKQTSRFSFQQRQGVVGHLNKTFEEKEEIRQKKERMLTLEREMKEENRQKAIEEKQRREDQQKRRMANEYKNSVYQTLRPEKLKGMSKKQLRMVRKTAMNKNGQLELVNPWNISERKKQGR
jgi:Cgr1 family